MAASAEGGATLLMETKNPAQVKKDKFLIAAADMKEHMAVVPSAPLEERPDCSGMWKCTDVDGDWDRYLELLGLEMTQRKLAFGSRYGKGHAMQLLTLSEARDSLSIVNIHFVAGATCWSKPSTEPGYYDPPMLEPRRMPPVVHALSATVEGESPTTGEGMRIGWEGEAIVSRHTVGDKKLPCVTKRRLFNSGREMSITVYIDNFYASRTFKPCYETGKLIDFYDGD